MIINLENDTDKKLDVMQSASKLLLNEQEKKNNKLKIIYSHYLISEIKNIINLN